MPWIHEVLVDFVSHNKNAVAQADIRQLPEFVLCPYTSNGIVGTAEYEQLHVVFNNLAFKVFKIDMVLISVEIQFVDDDLASVVKDARLEAVIDGFLNQEIGRVSVM